MSTIFRLPGNWKREMNPENPVVPIDFCLEEISRPWCRAGDPDPNPEALRRWPHRGQGGWNIQHRRGHHYPEKDPEICVDAPETLADTSLLVVKEEVPERRS